MVWLAWGRPSGPHAGPDCLPSASLGLTQLDGPCSMPGGQAHQSNTAHNLYLFAEVITITL